MNDLGSGLAVVRANGVSEGGTAMRELRGKRTATVVGMFFAIGFVLSIVVAFVSPYVYEGLTDSPALPTSVTIIACWVVLAGGGYLVDLRRHRKSAPEGADSPESPA